MKHHPPAKKRMLLDEFTQTTGYHRTYARWLLKHSEDVLQPVARRPRQPRYGPEVVDALVQAWNANNRKCTKCLIPFLPTLLDSLERHGYLHLTAECKKHVLSLSPATADRLLRASRRHHLHGISTTRAGTLLKQQIPIRTFEQWNEIQPGFVGEYTFRQLEELYRALCACMSIASSHPCALLSKQRTGKKISFCYDPAKTPLQRLLLSGFLPAETQQELNEVAQVLDPVRLLEHVQHLQHALFCCAVEAHPFIPSVAVVPLRVFAVEACTTGVVPARESIPDPSRGLPALYQQQEKRKRVLGWRRTHNDPFEGAWEQIASWVQANPERSSGDIFRELQRLSPGHQPLQIRTLQRRMRKIRAFLLETAREVWPEEGIHGQASDLIEPVQRKQEAGKEACSSCSGALASPVALTQENTSEHPFPTRSGTKETSSPRTATCPDQPAIVADGERSQAHHTSSFSGSRKRRRSQTIEQAIQDYLADQRSHNRRQKTVEWYQMALGLLQDYLLIECHMTLLRHMTQTELQGWLVFLGQQPTTRGTLRAAGTIASYARSARAFFRWVERSPFLTSTLFAYLPLPKAEPPLLEPLEHEQFHFLTVTETEYTFMMDINIKGVYFGAQAAAK